MLLTLYDSYGNAKARIAPDESSTQDKEIQGDNLLKLSFTLYEFVPIDVNDYMDYGGERYWAVEKYAPAQKSTVEWEYSLQLYGIESLIKRFLVLNNTDGENEAVFTLTARPVDHVRLIVKNINDGMDGTMNFKAGAVEGTENVVIDYTGKYCHEALKELAEAVGTEWWFDGETLNLCRCEHGEEVALGYDKGLTSLDRDTADGAKFYTRLFPIGSTRNIDPEKYGHSRLMLPDGAQYVDVNVEKYGIIHHYEQSAFAGIYPRRVGVVGSVRHEEVKDKDGKPFTIYYFRDNDLPFDPNDYEIGGLVKRVSFQEGSELAGLGTDNDHYFEVNFNSDTKEFEIITIWPYDDDTQLPGGTLVPKAGDKYILWNIRMPDEYYGLAEKELRSAVDEYNRKHALDVSRYKAPTDHVWMEETGTELFIGRRIRLESREYFPETGYRQSRITRISRKVNLPGQMDLEISDALSTGAMAKIDDAIADARNYAGTMVGTINVPDIIRSWDTTKPADTNLYSARRTHKEFLSKNSEDTAQKLITFLKGISLGKGGKYYLDEDGIAKLAKLMLGDFVKGSTGAGIYADAQGNWHIEGDYFHIRKKLTAEEVEIMKSTHIRGKVINSPGSFTVYKVEKIDGGWRCYFKQKDGEGRTVSNTMAVDDYAYCETFNLTDQSGKLSNHYWHRRVFGLGTDYVDICDNSNSDDYASGSDEPQVGDEVSTLGNRTNPERQHAIIQSAAGTGSPYYRMYVGIDSFSLPRPKIQMSPTEGSWWTVTDESGHEVTMEEYLSSLRSQLKAVQEQNDKQLVIWFGDNIPTLDTAPSSDWQDDLTRLEHLHDIYYNRSYAQTGGGRAYSFEQTAGGTGCEWREITDADVLKSLEEAVEAQRMAREAQTTADKAVDAVADMADDDRLTMAEKLTLLREWESIMEERPGLLKEANAAHVDRSGYTSALRELATYLNDGEAWDGSSVPSWLEEPGTRDISGPTFRARWSAFTSARTALQTAIGNSHIRAFASEPLPPYGVGDLWMDGSRTLVCVHGRDYGTSYDASDWTDLSDMVEAREPARYLQALAERALEEDPALTVTGADVKVYLGTSAAGHEDGDIAYSAGSGARIYTGSTATQGSSVLTAACAGAHAALGDRTIRLTRSSSASPSGTASRYDVNLVVLTAQDPIDGEYEERFVEVFVYNGDTWTLAGEAQTRGYLDIFGGKVRAVITGDNGDGTVGTSGLVTKNGFATVFSQTVDADGDIARYSGLATYMNDNDYVTGNSLRSYVSDHKFVTEASLDTYVKKVPGDDGSYTLESGIRLAADQITFLGKTVINDKFVVDDDGNVTMDGFTATNANITGTINAHEGNIAGFRISGNGLTNTPFQNDAYIIFRNDYHKCFAGIGGNVLPATTGARAVARFENEDEADQWGLGYNVAMVVSAKGAHVGDDYTGNCAIDILGGYIAGFGVKPKLIGLDTTTSSEDLGRLSVTLKKSVGAIWASTQYYYKHTVDGKEVKDTKVRDVQIMLPSMTEADEGKMIWIKRGSNSRGELSLLAGIYSYKEYEGGRWTNKSSLSYFLIDDDKEATSVSIISEGDAMCFIFFPTLTVTMNNYTYHGCWIQWKAPRDW